MKEPKEKNEMQVAMDEALVEATKELSTLKTAADVASWLRKWFMKAGYKRLNRALMAYFPVKK